LGTFVNPPSISSVTPSSAAPGDTITIVGEGFGVVATDVHDVDVGGQSCLVSLWELTRIVCRIPSPHPIWVEALANSTIVRALRGKLGGRRSGGRNGTMA
jgi:hypothetical protein